MLRRMRSMLGLAEEGDQSSRAPSAASGQEAGTSASGVPRGTSAQGASTTVRDGAACGPVLLVARQPVFDASGEVWGYELLFRRPDSPECCSGDVDASVATASVIADGFAMARPALGQGQRLLVNFAVDMLLAGTPRILPADVCGVEVLETVPATESVLLALSDLKSEGYLIVVDDYAGQPGMDALLDMADIVKIDVLGRPLAELARDVAGLRPRQCLLLAEKVEDLATHRQCEALGFALFQGFFFSRPELVHGRRLDSSQAAKMRLLATLAREDVNIKAASEVVRSDAALSYKLLRYINSVHFGLPVKVTSIQHGISLLGTRNLVQWLCVTVLSEFDTGPMARELIAVSALRAKFLELCATRALLRAGQVRAGQVGAEQAQPVPPVPQSGALFMLGLFSLLEPLLCLPLAELLRSLPLVDDLTEALTAHTGPFAPWLELMEHYERGRWDDVLSSGEAMGLSQADLAVAYAGALEWTSFFHDSRE
ncbi:HDOD domain-containing protein [Nitratidesulfovibrio liaohensis]|uniref:HDOD domain-containing protein n=1 Tax=Nitratidesulfovibrio liaohensis TaxID=2604158 RepID=A0ABY9R3G4_9BACT|nr:HDOD domain-containing protein [Nitratidesulfovibrio liaohensis]WMW65538.1 HDOD domain-containing protein [Nitratidesulfovibrio liaohensis]